ncbi:glycosyltransferase [Eubacterium sp.]
MKFLIQIPQLIFAGAEKVLVSFANDLVARGNEVEILETYEKGLLKTQFDERVVFNAICSNKYTKKYYASLDDIRAEKSLIKKILKCFKLLFSKVVGYRKFAEKLASRYYKKREYDVAINFLEIDSPEFILKNINAKKYIQWYHTDVANLDYPEETDKMIPLYKKMDAIICVAESAKKSFVERYPELSDKTYVIYNFFDVETIVDKSKENFSYQVKNDELILLSVGRMTTQKSYGRFLNVLSRVKNDGYNFIWYVLGDGQEKEKIEMKITELNLNENVVLVGLTDNPYKYMKNCDLFVLPSEWEGFPTVTVEAKILSCPVLATDVSGIKEQLIHGETGWIVNNDENAIYEGLKYLFDNLNLLEKLKSNKGIDHICNNDLKYNKFMEIIA